MIYLLLLLAVPVALLWIFGSREKVDLTATFDPAALGHDLDAYFATEEAKFPDIIPGAAKRVIWASAQHVKTSVSVLYIHGFSACSEEIRPVPDNLAQALGANLVYTRLSGHGRGGAAMAEPEAGDWMRDAAEALAAARQVGTQVIVVATSTGGTVLAAAALREDLMQNVAGLIFVSPNFAIRNPAAFLLTLPGVRWWGPKLVGAERRFDPINAQHAAFWTTRYPTVAALPMAALVKAVSRLNLGAARTPALFMFCEKDAVVSPRKTRAIARQWGGPSQIHLAALGPGDDPWNHVIAGDILSPGQTGKVSKAMIDWSKDILAR
ncbi:MAG: alpha/beta fold hydrolase [Pseudomonadota bacterium]